MKVNILGVKIDDVSQDEALARIEKWIWNLGKHYIVTPNPEFIVAAQKDELFKNILNKADLSIPDGVGLKLSGKIKNILPGIDLMESLIRLSAEKGFVVGFLGGRPGVAEKCAECLKKKYSGLKVVFAGSGGEVDDDGRWKMEDGTSKMEDGRWKKTINLSSTLNPQKTTFYPLSSTVNIPPTDILFVAFGQIKQEKWIAQNQDTIPVKIAMGVGGAFDYLSGSVPRAPKWMRDLSFEWLFRFLVQPQRFKRQLALIKYLWLLLRM